MSNLTVAPVLHVIPIRQRAWERVLARHWPILLLTVAFVVLGAVYSVTTPLFEAPDEPAHYRQVVRAAHGEEAAATVLPGPAERETLRQPPLYYAVGGLLTRRIGLAADGPVYEANPHAALGTVDVQANKNAVLHLEDDRFPYRGVSLAMHVLRWFSVLCSAVTVVLVYLAARQIAPERGAMAVGVAALAAFNPQFLFTSGAVSNDSLATLWATATLYLALRVVNGGERVDVPAALLGLCAGLAALTRIGALPALLLIPAAGAARARSRDLRSLTATSLRPAAIALAVALAVCGWWYAGLLAPGGLVAAQPQDVEAAAPGASVGSVVGSLVLSFWGVFGWMNVPADATFYSLVRIVTLLGVLGVIPALAWVYWRERTFRPYRWRAALVLGAWPAILVASLALGATALYPEASAGGIDGRLLFPAIASISFILFVGVTAWFPRRYVGVVGAFLTVGMGMVAARAPAWYIAPAYAAPPRIALEQVPDTIHDLGISYGDELFLLGYELPQETVRAGENLNLRLYWLARRAMDTDYSVAIRVAGRRGERIGAIDTFHGGGNLPTRGWLPGDVVVDEYVVPIVPDAVGPVAAAIRVGVYGGPERERLPSLDARLRPIEGPAEIARVRVAPARTPRLEPANRMTVNLGHRVVLTGYDLSPAAPEAGKNLVVDLYWKPLTRLNHNYTVFVHLVDADGILRGQIDEQPVQGDYPTRLWIPEDTVRDAHTLALPADLASGPYWLNVGLYLVETGERLEIVDSDPAQSAVTLGPIEIAGR